MCGVSGFFSLDFSTDTREARPILEAMARSLHHRGPDSCGYHVGADVCFAFTRLAIVDLQTGDQPLYSEDRQLVCICNGEIYNYQRLREELIAKGHTFATGSDVEVILHLYEEVGDRLVEYLRGQFAFALYDGKRQIFLAARDQVGICPFYYSVHQGRLLFASEIKALLQYPGFNPGMALKGLDQILTFPGPVSPQTLFEGVYALPPGHLLKVADGRLTTEAYWDLDYPRLDSSSSVRSADDYRELLIERLQEAVALRLNADVPVGFYLSGGLDSTFIGRLIHHLRPEQRWSCFSIGFVEQAIDEQRHQQQALKGLDVDHHVSLFDWEQMANRLVTAVRHAESPLKESYNTCSLALSEMVRNNGYKVVLSGEGADELFGGYVGYRLDRLRTPDPFPDMDEILEQDVREGLWNDRHFYYERDYHGFNELKQGLYSPDLSARLDTFNCTARSPVDTSKLEGRDPFHKRSYIDFKLRIADHLLADHGDRVAMAHSVEARYPFLDTELIKAVREIPPALMIQGGTEKYLLKQAARGYVPDAVIEREKFAFVAPGSDYLMRNNRDFVESYLGEARIRNHNIFNWDTVKRLKDNCIGSTGSINQTFETDLLMIVLTTSIFLEEFSL